jgi:hypothetical protein
MSPRQLNSLAFLGVGVLLMMVPMSVKAVIDTYPPLVAAFLYALSPVGLIFTVLALYRLATKEGSK